MQGYGFEVVEVGGAEGVVEASGDRQAQAVGCVDSEACACGGVCCADVGDVSKAEIHEIVD